MYILFLTVLLKVEQILAISDVDFLKAFVEYFIQLIPKGECAASQDAKIHPVNEEDIDFQPATKEPSVASIETGSVKKIPSRKMPKVKLEASVKDISVAILETFKDDEPQALALKVRLYTYVCMCDCVL